MLVIHTSDIHLGAKLGFLEEAAGKQREYIRQAFSKTIDLAISKQADLFLIGGDLFDSNLPARATIDFVIEQFQRLIKEHIHIAIIPGNHDNYAITSVYRLADWQKLNSEFFHLFTNPDVAAWELPELDTVIYGAAVVHKKSSINQITNFVPVLADYTYKIGLFHGSVDVLSMPDNYPLPVADLKKLPLNYVALGDWHGQIEISKAKPTIWYAGSPELLASDQEKSGKVLLVELDESGQVKVEQCNVGVTQTVHLTVDVADFTSSQDMIRYIFNEVGVAAKNTVLLLQLDGIAKLEDELDLEDLTVSLKERFLVVVVENKSSTSLSIDELTKGSESLVIGRYIDFLDDYLATNPTSIPQVQRAKILGIRLLNGGEIDGNN